MVWQNTDKNLFGFNNLIRIHIYRIFFGLFIFTFLQCKVTIRKESSCDDRLLEIKGNWKSNAYQDFAYCNKNTYEIIRKSKACLLGKTEKEIIAIFKEPRYSLKNDDNDNPVYQNDYHYYIKKSKKHPKIIKTLTIFFDHQTGKAKKILNGSFSPLSS